MQHAGIERRLLVLIIAGLLGHLWNLFGLGPSDGSYAIIGAAAVLAASTQGPVSAFVLIVELTHHVDTLVIPLLLAIATAVITTRALETRSIYSGRIHTGREAAETDPWTISASAGYQESLQTALRDPSRSLSVVDQHGEPVGEICPGDLAHPTDRLPLTEIATAGDLARR